MLTGVIDTGTAIWSDDLMVPLVTGDRPQERYFTFGYSPLIADSGDVYGVFCAVTETTARVLSERRLHVLNAVASAVLATQTIDDAVRAAIAVCATQPTDLPFVAVYVDDGTASHKIALRGATPSMTAVAAPDAGAADGLRGAAGVRRCSWSTSWQP